jgi:SAM-dependent methyltransferase
LPEAISKAVIGGRFVAENAPRNDTLSCPGDGHLPCRTKDQKVHDTIASYDAMAHAYAERWFAFRLYDEMARFAQLLAPGARVLDMGCGTGQDTAWLAEQGYAAAGVDLSGGMLREARRRGVMEPLVQADMRALPFRSGSCCGLWVCASLLHIPKKEVGVVLRELRRVIDRGQVYIAVKRGTGEAWVEGQGRRRRFFAYYTGDELGRLVEQAGFEVLSCWEAADQAGRTRPWINLLARSRGQGGAA